MEGEFLPGTRLVLEPYTDDIRGFSILCPEGGEAVSEWIRDGSYAGAVQVRLLCEDAEDIHIEVEKEGVYTEVPAETMGSYLVFSMEQPGSFRVVRDTEPKAALIWTAAGCGAAVLLLSLLLILFLRRRARR